MSGGDAEDGGAGGGAPVAAAAAVCVCDGDGYMSQSRAECVRAGGDRDRTT